MVQSNGSIYIVDRIIYSLKKIFFCMIKEVY